MSISGGPKVSTNGLIFYIDTFNTIKSYKGEPTTNLIGTWAGDGNEYKHTYPTTGNSWGSYHVELYNNASFFAITSSGGSVNVTNNIATSSVSHPFKTYSVVTPATTGGGLTAGTNYFIKKLDSASFSVHTYNSTLDVGNSVFSSLTQSISINSTNFPTLWKGSPHINNSTHYREVMINGFNGHDCLRIHHFRTADIQTISGSSTHGMAYGVYPVFVSGSTYTFSFYHRAATSTAVGKGIAFSRWTNGNSDGSTFTLSSNWTKYTHTCTSTASAGTNIYFLTADLTSNFSYDISEIQVELGTNASTFVPKTRSISSSLYDITNNNVIISYNTPYSSSIEPSFNGLTGYIDLQNNVNAKTIIAVIKPGRVDGTHIIYGPTANGSDNWFSITTARLTFYGTETADVNNFTFAGTVPISTNTYYHVVTTIDTNTVKLYVNGISDGSSTQAFTIGSWNSAASIGRRGGLNQSYYTGSIPLLCVYNRVMSDVEILNHFNSIRSRFRI